MNKLYFLIFFCLLSIINLHAKKYIATNVQEFEQYKLKLSAGDTLQFANGVWNDVNLLISGRGTMEAPIVYISETPGSVVFSGNSKISIAGSFVEVNGLLFKNGYSQKGVVIEFRESSANLANNCRVTNCVIDNYNNPNRLADDHWVALYGKNNRFDHNYLTRKKNVGTTLIVELNDIRNQENNHRIDHNYFGERPRLGSNGGETIRIGTSTFSRTSSRTIVEENYFEHCSGEVEIVSVKSCDNILRRNTFYECEGGLVLRHGDRNIIESNFFIGNDKPNTGGVRVINAGHKIYNNFFYKLAGERFRSALTILNGVPNSPINRYDPVKDVVIANNVFVECNAIELSAGKDLERTAKPEDVLLSGNVFYSDKKNLFQVNDDISGIKFLNNYSSVIFPNVPATGFKQGPIKSDQNDNQWKITVAKFSANAAPPELKSKLEGVSGKLPDYFKPYATVQNTGVQWYKANDEKATLGKQISVTPGENTLYEKALTASAGDTLLLQPGTYPLNKTIIVKFPLHIAYTGDGQTKPLIQFTGEKGGFTFFSIENGGELFIKNIRLNGLSDNGTAESFIATSQQPMIEHYKLFVDGCDFLNITDGRKHALKVNKASYADTIEFANCFFNDISGDVISIAAEKEDKGIYNAEYVIFKNCVFNKVLMGAIDLYRGGNDESTTGPYFIMDHCTFNEVGNVELGYVLRLNGVQHSKITNTIFNNSGRAGRTVKYEDYGWTNNKISYCNSYQAGRIESFYNNIVSQPMWKVPPQFVNIA